MRGSPSLLHSVTHSWMPILFSLEEVLAFSLAEENLGLLACPAFFFFPLAMHSSSGSEVRNEGGTRRSYISTHTALATSVTKLEIKQVVVADGCGHRGKSEING